MSEYIDYDNNMISFKFPLPSILVLFNFLLQSKGLDHGSSNPGGHQPFGIVLTSAPGDPSNHCQRW